MMETQILASTARGSIEFAVEVLNHGGLVAFPTDTVYGLGAIISDRNAIERLFKVKGRDTSKAIAVLVGEYRSLKQVAGELNDLAQRLAAKFWPGPLTLVVSANPDLPANLSPSPYIGVRMPDHPIALQLLRMAGPLAVTSANLSGGPDTRTAQQVFDQLQGKISLILDGGETPGGKPSTVVECYGSDLVILRQGPLSIEQLRGALS